MFASKTATREYSQGCRCRWRAIERGACCKSQFGSSARVGKINREEYHALYQGDYWDEAVIGAQTPTTVSIWRRLVPLNLVGYVGSPWLYRLLWDRDWMNTKSHASASAPCRWVRFTSMRMVWYPGDGMKKCSTLSFDERVS